MKKVLKWVGIVLGGLILLVVGTVYISSEVRLNRTYKIKKARLTVPADDLSIERGRHLVTAVAKCVDCHGEDLGGHVILDEPVIGTIAGPNLTRGKGGRAALLTDEDYVRAIRHGVGRDGKPLPAMPTEGWHFDDDELGAIIAYVKSVPPVDRESNQNTFGPLLRALMLLGQVELTAEEVDHEAVRKPSPAPGVTLEYGKHMALTGGCMGCHGPTLTGGPIPGAPPDWPAARNLTPDNASGIGSWTEEDFFNALRTGKRPDGAAIRMPMPVQATARMTDTEIKALWLYLRSLKPLQAGNR